MNEALVNGLFVLAGTILGSLISLFTTMYSNKSGMKRSIQLSNRDKVMELCVELARLLNAFKGGPEFSFTQKKDVTLTAENSLNASIAISRYWDNKRGELEIFLPENFIRKLKGFLFNTSSFVENSPEYPDTNTYNNTSFELSEDAGVLIKELKKVLDVV